MEAQPKHQSTLNPMHHLFKEGLLYRWLKVGEDAFIATKQLIVNYPTQVHDDLTKPLFLSCDASS